MVFHLFHSKINLISIIIAPKQNPETNYEI